MYNFKARTLILSSCHRFPKPGVLKGLDFTSLPCWKTWQWPKATQAADIFLLFHDPIHPKKGPFVWSRTTATQYYVPNTFNCRNLRSKLKQQLWVWSHQTTGHTSKIYPHDSNIHRQPLVWLWCAGESVKEVLLDNGRDPTTMKTPTTAVKPPL